MKDWVQRKLNDVISDDVQAKMKEKMAESGVTVPISASMLMRIFHKPPVTTYEEKQIHINLNEIDKVKVIPVGKIKQFSIQDQKLRVKIGL